MGDLVQRESTTRLRGWAVGLLVGAQVVALSCSSAPKQRTAAPAPAVAQETAPIAPATPPPLTIESLDVREGAPGMIVDVTASAPLVWTSYRTDDGRLVIELPNSVRGSSLPQTVAGSGIVGGIEIAQESGGSRPLVRLTISASEEYEHSLVADGSVLRLELAPAHAPEAVAASAPGGESAQEELAYEPVAAGSEEPEASAAEEPAEMAAAEVEAPAGAPAEDFGTPESPRRGPSPGGRAATKLKSVEALPDGSVRVLGDGEFAYSTFRLEEPSRFVIDLEGVSNAGAAALVPVGDGPVRRVRTAQFKPAPTPVSRVVFDLDSASVPQIERTASGLTVRFAPPSSGRAAEHLTKVAAAEPVVREPRMTAPVTKAPEVVERPAPAPREEPIVARSVASEEKPAAPAEAPPARTATPSPISVVGPTAESSRGTPPLASPPRAELMPQAKPASDLGLYAKSAQAEASEDSEARPRTFTTRTFGARSIGGTERTYSGDPLSMTLRDADVVETLRSFAAISGLSIVVQPEVKGSVTVELDNVPWDQALEQILRVNRLGYEIEGTVMRIAPVSVLKAEAKEQQELATAKALQVPLKTVMRRLSYASANDIARLLRSRGSILSARGSVLIDRRTNSLIIKELPDFMDTATAVIDELDTPEPQVMIEARIVETTTRFTRTLGVSWSFDGEASARYGNTTGLIFPNNVRANGGVNLITGARNGVLGLSLGNVLNNFNLDVTLQAAENEGLIRILSAPKVAVLNNEEAEIQSGLQLPIQTISNNTVTTQFVKAGLQLLVTPHVTAEGTVLMEVEVKKREPQFAFALPGSQNAPIDTKEARTRVIVRDGGTTVIGGIYKLSSDQGQDRVPGLANIPIIGEIFKNRRRIDQNEELLIFITPRVINL